VKVRNNPDGQLAAMISDRGAFAPRFDLCQYLGEIALGHFGIVRCLCSKPIAVGKAEKAAKAQIGIGRNGTPGQHDLADSLRRYADLFG